MHSFRTILYNITIALLSVIAFSACSSEKFLSNGSTVLSSVKIKSAEKTVNAKNYDRYLKQHPNSKWFGLVKVPLGIYCIAGKDTSRHHALHKLGESPVVYDSVMSKNSLSNLRNALISAGYLKADANYTERRKGYKTNIEYTIFPGPLYSIDNIEWNIENPEFRKIVRNDSANSHLFKGMACDVNVLNEERNRIVKLLQNSGYYNVNRDFVSFVADTSAFSKNVSLLVNISFASGARDSVKAYTRYHIGKVNFYYNINEDSVENISKSQCDTVNDGYGSVVYSYGHAMLRNKTMLRNVYFRPGDIYNQSKIRLFS